MRNHGCIHHPKSFSREKISHMSCPVPIGTSILSKKCIPPRNDDEWDQAMAKFKQGLKTDPMYLKRVKISALAAIKLIQHANDGVKEGRADPERCVPLEVMGNLLGFIDPEDEQCLVITDSFITPCKGGAHSSDPDARTAGYRVDYEEIYGFTNPRVKQVGWYHSHPFEPLNDAKSCTTHHCWFSAIDVGTQTQAQGIQDRYGMPYVGIVIDPQTTLERRQIHFGCFRTYNRLCTSSSVTKGRTPDGKSLIDFGDSANNSRWGDQWDKYYALDVSFFTNEENKKTLSILNASYGWINDLVLTKTSQSTFKQVSFFVVVDISVMIHLSNTSVFLISKNS